MPGKPETAGKLDEWRKEAWAVESAPLAATARSALGDRPSADAARAAATGARALADGLAPDLRARAVELVRFALASKQDDVAFDGLVVAADLALTETRAPIDAILGKEGSKIPWIRGMALHALARILPVAEGKALLDKARREDASWVARNIAQEALITLEGRPDAIPPLFARYGWLSKTYRLRVRGPVGAYGVEKWSKLGIALPPAVRLYYAQVLGGGTVELTDEGAGKEATRRGTFVVRVPEDAPKAAASLQDLNDFVWKKYVDLAKTPGDDEQALRRFADHYDDARRPFDKDAWAYGVLLFESAFRDEKRRAERLLRAREVLEGWLALTGEKDWDVVADRLAEARDMIANEKLETAARMPRLYPFARMSSIEILIDAARAGGPILGRPIDEAEEGEDDDDNLQSSIPGQTARAKPSARPSKPPPDATEIAPSFAHWINDPRAVVIAPTTEGEAAPITLDTVAAAGGGEASALVLVSEAKRLAEENKDLKRAGRLHLDALDLDQSKSIVAPAVAFLGRKDVDAGLAAELLAEVALDIDEKSSKIIQLVFAGLSADRAKEIVAVLERMDTAGGGESSAARLVDAIASFRPKSLVAVRDQARAIRDRRGETHLRTVKNKWYKPFKKD